MEWSNIPLRDRAKIISIGVKNGLRDLKSIKSEWKKFSEGGKLNIEKSNVPTYPIASPDSSSLAYFRNNPNVAGMAVGKGMNGYDGERRVLINPYNPYMQDPVKQKGLQQLESYRHYADSIGYTPKFSLTPEQRQVARSLGVYANDSNAFKNSLISRYYVGDNSYNLTPQQRAEADSILYNNRIHANEGKSGNGK